MIAYNEKHYDVSFQNKASVWWRTLSINKMKELERKHGTLSYMATASEVAAIYDKEMLEG